MKKNLLKSREDFIELKNYYKNKVYDAVGFVAEDEDEPNEYPCVMVSRHEPYDEDFFLFNLRYYFVYQSDFTA